MRFTTALALALSALLAVSAFGVVAAAPSAPTAPGDDSVSSPTAATDRPLDDAEPRQVIRISVGSNGDAEWAIESRYVLEDEDDVEAFSSYADAVTDGERDVDYDVEAFERTAADAEAATDREMEIADAGWGEPRIERENESETAAEIPEDEVAENDSATGVGVISYTFTWTNFAETDGSYVHVGDTFQAGDDLWFPGLTAGQQLIIESPPGYGFDSFPPVSTTDEGSLVWDGPHEFSENELEVVYLRGADDSPPPPPPDDSGFLDSQVATLGGAGLVAVLVGAVFLLRRSAVLTDEDDGDESPPPTDEPATPSPPSVEETTPVAAAAGENADTTVTFEEPDDDVDPELLSDEERVSRLLRENGGRMKQASIVKETGWSNAKVSQLLSKMDEDEEIEKLRIGRENLITLPEVDPTEPE